MTVGDVVGVAVGPAVGVAVGVAVGGKVGETVGCEDTSAGARKKRVAVTVLSETELGARHTFLMFVSPSAHAPKRCTATPRAIDSGKVPVLK